MKELAKRVWNEPAVAIGLLTSVALLVLNLLSGNSDTVNWIEVAAPLLAALGIRPLVKPTAKIDEENAQAARSKLQTTPVTDTERQKGF